MSEQSINFNINNNGQQIVHNNNDTAVAAAALTKRKHIATLLFSIVIYAARYQMHLFSAIVLLNI